jgi:hypothetical protein
MKTYYGRSNMARHRYNGDAYFFDRVKKVERSKRREQSKGRPEK